MAERGVTLELFTRAGAVGTHDRLAEAIGRVRALDADDRVSGCRVHTWNKQLVPTGDGTERQRWVLERIEEFESWARERGVTLYPFFEERTRSSVLIDDEQPVIVLPVICLAVYEGERVREVFPRSDGDLTYTVFDGLAALETGVGTTPFALSEKV